MEIPVSWKIRAARIIRIPLLRRLLGWAVRLLVPRQRLGVAVILLDEAGRVLLLRHVFHPLAPWGLPGGWVNRNEAPAAGARRELKEETGLTAELGPVVHLAYDPNPPHVGIAYLAWSPAGNLRLSLEIIEARWFDIDQLPTHLFSYMKDAIDAAFHYNNVIDNLPIALRSPDQPTAVGTGKEG